MKKKIEILVACLASLLMMTSCWLDYEYDNPDPVIILDPPAYKDTIYYTEGDNFLDVVIDTVNYLSSSTVDTVKFFMSYEFATDTINGKPIWRDYPQGKILQQNKNRIRIEKIPNFDDDSVRFKIYAISYDNGLASYISAKLINFSEISSGKNLLKLNPRYINDTIMVSLDSVLSFPEDKTFDLFIRGHFVYLHGSLLYYNDNTYENKDVFLVDRYGVDINNNKLVLFVYLDYYMDVFSLKEITIKNKIIYFPPNPQIVGRDGNNIFVLIPESTKFLEFKIIN